MATSKVDKRIQKIIAREGLIIIGIVFLGMIVNALPPSIVLKDSKTPIDLLTQERWEIRYKPTGIIYTIIVDKKDVKEKIEGHDFTKADAIEELANKGEFRGLKNLNVVKKELPLVDYQEMLISFTLLAYPMYLFVRFIVWAVKALLEK